MYIPPPPDIITIYYSCSKMYNINYTFGYFLTTHLYNMICYICVIHFESWIRFLKNCGHNNRLGFAQVCMCFRLCARGSLWLWFVLYAREKKLLSLLLVCFYWNTTTGIFQPRGYMERPTLASYRRKWKWGQGTERAEWSWKITSVPAWLVRGCLRVRGTERCAGALIKRIKNTFIHSLIQFRQEYK